MFLLYLNAVSVTNNKGGGDASHGLHMEFSTKVRAPLVDCRTRHTPSPQDYYAIQEIHSDKNVFRLVVGYVVRVVGCVGTCQMFL